MAKLSEAMSRRLITKLTNAQHLSRHGKLNLMKNSHHEEAIFYIFFIFLHPHNPYAYGTTSIATESSTPYGFKSS